MRKIIIFFLLFSSPLFAEDFKLENTLHETGISEYYTWEYLGENQIMISEKQQVKISINPNGNVMGSVSVSILQN